MNAERGSSRARSKALKKNEIAMRRKQVAALMLARMTATEIAEKIGFSKALIDQDVLYLRAEWRVEQRLDTAVAQEHELAALAKDETRIRGFLAALSTEQHRTRVQYQDLILKIMAARSKILGLDAPTKIEQRISSQIAFTDDVAKIISDPDTTKRLLDAVQRQNRIEAHAASKMSGVNGLNGGSNGVAH